MTLYKVQYKAMTALHLLTQMTVCRIFSCSPGTAFREDMHSFGGLSFPSGIPVPKLKVLIKAAPLSQRPCYHFNVIMSSGFSTLTLFYGKFITYSPYS